MTDRSFQRANDESRQRLARLVAMLTPATLEVDLGEGWTVASALAHTGFWDRWQAERWTEMLAGRWTADDESVIGAEHLANSSLHPYWSGVTAENIPALAVEAATSLDALIASAPDAIVDALEGTPSAYLLHRHRHRGEHLDQIERSLAAAVPLDRSFVERNAESRRRLAGILGRLTAEDLARRTAATDEGSWTVAQVLGHLAFWDRSMETRWLMAQAAAPDGGSFEPASIPGGMTEAINRPLASLLGAWTVRIGLDIGAEALAAAESVDALLVSLGERLPAGVAATRPHLVSRWIHREPPSGLDRGGSRRHRRPGRPSLIRPDEGPRFGPKAGRGVPAPHFVENGCRTARNRSTIAGSSVNVFIWLAIIRRRDHPCSRSRAAPVRDLPNTPSSWL